MKEESLIALITESRVHDDRTSQDKAVSALCEFIYTNFHQFKIDCANEDIRSDYIVWMYPRFSGIIKHYNPDKASFRTYLNWVIRLSFRTFLRSWYSAEAKQRVYEAEETTRLMSVEAEMENSGNWHENASENEAPYQNPKIRGRKTLSTKKKEIQARKIFLLACKAGINLDDSLVWRIARKTGYSESYLRSKLDSIHLATATKRERTQMAIEKQNRYYIRAQKCLYEMKSFERSSIQYENLEKEYTYCIKRWNDIRNSPERKIYTPSNRFLAVTLGISRGTIDATLASLKENEYSPLS